MKRRRLSARDGDVLRPAKRRLATAPDPDDVLPLLVQAEDATTTDPARRHGVESRDEGARRLGKRAAQPLMWDQGRQYGIVVDAGSSGSRIQVYSWRKHDLAVVERKTDGKKLDVLPRVETGVEEGDGWHLKVEPGISTFGTHPDDVGDYIKPLLDRAVSIIPPSAVPSTPFYLLATAGMRLLPDSERDAVLQATCFYVRRHYRFSLPDCASHIRVISGEEEGLYGWVAVNYLLDGFDSHDHESTKKASTYGFLDMGGASTQIAFEPNDVQRLKHADNLTTLTLRLLNGVDVSHSVFVTTWLGYGTNQARDRYIKDLVTEYRSKHGEAQTGAPDAVVSDPCLPTSLVLASGHPGYSLGGNGDFMTCMKTLSPLLNKNAPCLDEPCLFDGKHVPPIDFAVNHFIGISEYWYSMHDVWASVGGVYDFVEFEQSAVDYCGRPWDDIVKDHKEGKKWPSHVELSRLQMQCFKAAWIVNILHEGIGVPRLVDSGGHGDQKDHAIDAIQKAAEKGLTDAPPTFQSLNDVGKVAISWTLGKMVLEVAQSVPRSLTTPIGGEYAEGAREPHVARPGIGSTLVGAAHKVDPLAVVGMIALAVVLYFFCGSGRVGRGILVNFFRPRSARDAYVLANMEEGGQGAEGDGSSRPGTPTGRGLGKFKPWGLRLPGVFGGGNGKGRPSRLRPQLFGRSTTRASSPSRPAWSLRRVATGPATYTMPQQPKPKRPNGTLGGTESPKVSSPPPPKAAESQNLRSVRSSERLGNGGPILRPLSRQSTEPPRAPFGHASSFNSLRSANTPSPAPMPMSTFTDSHATSSMESSQSSITSTASTVAGDGGLSVDDHWRNMGGRSGSVSPAGSMTNLNGYFMRRGVSGSREGAMENGR